MEMESVEKVNPIMKARESSESWIALKTKDKGDHGNVSLSDSLEPTRVITVRKQNSTHLL